MVNGGGSRAVFREQDAGLKSASKQVIEPVHNRLIRLPAFMRRPPGLYCSITDDGRPIEVGGRQVGSGRIANSLLIHSSPRRNGMVSRRRAASVAVSRLSSSANSECMSRGKRVSR